MHPHRAPPPPAGPVLSARAPARAPARSPQAFLDGPSEDIPALLLRWAVGLLSAERAEWGQAMLGELGYIDGRARRLRFTLGCVTAALLLPPWGRAAAGAWAMIAVAA